MMKRLLTENSRICTLILCLCIPAWPVVVQAQTAPASQFIFPRFVSFPDESTGIAIFNPHLSPATVTLTLRSYDGSLITDVINPATLTIPARGQIARIAGELFGTSVNIDASLEISSTVAGLIAYCQTFDPLATFLDGGDAPQASTALVFPVIPSGTEGIAEIDFINPNARETSVELKLWHLDGHLLGTATIQVPSGGLYRNMVHSVFPPGTDFRGVSHMTAASKPRSVLSAAQSVAGTTLFAGMSATVSPGGYIDRAALNAVPVTETSTTGTLPYFRTGGPYASTLSLANIEPAAVSVTVSAIANNGGVLGARTLSLNPQGGLRTPLQSIIPELAGGEREGWLLIQASGRITGAMVYGRNDAASLTAMPMQRAPKAEIVFPHIVQGYGSYTEVTLVNPVPFTGNVGMQIVGQDGSTLAAGRITLSPNQRVSLPVNQLLPEMEDDFIGVLHVQSNQVLFASATIWSDSGSTASNLKPQDTVFFPAPLASFAITGTVFLNDTPQPGFRVALSGPTAKTATSNDSGLYAFTGLQAGEYSISVDQPGLQFVPEQVTIEITDASTRQDFWAFTVANIIVVVPSALPVHSPDTTLTIHGAGFDPTSEAFADVTRLQTKYLDPTHLEAVLPAFLTAFPEIFDIVIVTNGAGPSPIVSQPCPFITYQNKPVLSSVVTGGIITEAAPGQTITLEGAGFLQGAIVKVNGVSDGIEADVIDHTEIKAYIPASYFQRAGKYPVTVVNPYPANAESNVQFLSVAPFGRPVLDSLVVPEPILEGSLGRYITLKGTGFQPGAIVKLGGLSEGIQVSVISDKEIVAYLPSTYFERGGNYLVTVQNPYPGTDESNSQILPVYYPPPGVEGVLPVHTTVKLEAGAGALNIDVMGYGFRRGAVVMFNATPLVTTYCEDSAYCLSVHLFAKVPPELLRRAGYGKIEVKNPDPSLNNYQAVYLRVDGLQPTIASVQPGSAALQDLPFKFWMPVVVDGTNFGPETLVRIYQAGADPLPEFSATSVDVVSSTQLFVSIEVLYPGSLGEWIVKVANPGPGGGISEDASFFITEGSFVSNPFLTSLSPRTVAAGGPSFTLTVNGTNFKSGSVIYFNYLPLVTTVISDRQVRAQVPSTLIRYAGRIPISVQNPDNGGTSNRLFLEVR
jgi:hypothetical protein